MFTVNHNGTEDWVELPDNAVRLGDGRVGFATVEQAAEFGATLARDVIAFEQRDLGSSYAAARDALRDTDEGVPVQIVDADSGAVVGTINPDTVAPHFGEET
jgi:hypothetical protein